MGFFSEFNKQRKNWKVNWKNAAKFVGSVALGGVVGGPVGAIAVVGGWVAYDTYKEYKQFKDLEFKKIQKENKTKSKIEMNPEKDAKRAKKRAFLKALGAFATIDPAFYGDVNKDMDKTHGNNQQMSTNSVLFKINKGKDPR